MKLKKSLLVIISFTIAGVLGWWLLLRPTFELTYYQLKECPELYITQIQYWKPGERGVAFAFGRHLEKSLPKDCLINPSMSGFDAILEAVFTCDEQRNIVINYNEGYYKIQGNVTGITEKRINSTDFQKLKNNSNNLFIQLE